MPPQGLTTTPDAAPPETLGRVKSPPGKRLAILTNGGGIGVLAVDRLVELDGIPADISPATREKLDAADWTSPESLKEAVLAAGEAHGLKLGKAQAPVRVAVTGRTVGLPLFESLEVLGKEKTLARIDAALTKLAA